MSISNHFGWGSRAFRSAIAGTAVLVASAWLVAIAAAQQAGKDAKSAPAEKAAKTQDAAGAGKAAPPAKADPKGAAAKAGEAPAPKAAPPAPPAKTEAAEPAEATAPPAAIKYKQDLSDEDFKSAVDKFRREKSKVQKMLRAQTFLAGEESQFDSYYSEFAMPRWTVPENYASLPEFRRELRNDLFAGKSGPPYDRLLGLAFDFMSKVSGPGYHPAVRYNATMTLGDLNVQEFPPGAKTPVQPHPGALKVLIGAVKSSDSDAVRVAALLGLQRHASAGIADAQIRDGQIIPMLLDLAKSSPPPGRSSEGHAWLRALAIDVLATLHMVGPNGLVVGTLVGIVGDKNVPTFTRCAAARALGTFDYKGFNAFAPSQLATPIGQLALEMCSAELAKTRPATKTAAKTGLKGGGRAMGSMMMPGDSTMSDMPGAMPGAMPGMSGMSGMARSMKGTASGQQQPDDEESADRILRLRRNLKYYLNAARLGLNGPNDSQNGGIRLFAAKFEADLKKLADSKDPDWKFVDGVFKAVQDHIRILDGEEEEYAALAKKISTSRTKLRDLVNPPAADKGPAKSTPAGPAKK